MEHTDEHAAGSATLKILALGSPHGDDRVAWHVADSLQRDDRLVGTVHKIASPWDVIDHLQSVNRLVVLDACRSGAPIGAIVRRKEHDLHEIPEGCRSTHGGQIADALRMARALGKHCDDVLFLGVEIETPSGGEKMSDAACRAAVFLEAEVRANLSRWQLID
jgi:hydrogenase maturation protease